MEIRSKTISYSAWNKKRKVESSLENEINDLTDKVSQGDSTAVDLLNSKQAELVDIRKNKIDGVLIRSKTRWIEHGEKPSKYFLNMEKRNCVNKTMSCVIKDDSTELKSSKDILLEARHLKKKLYSVSDTNNNIDLQSIFKNSDSPVLSNTTRDNLEGPLSHQAILNVLKKTKNGKSPGSDGFSFEFYKLFFTDLS